MTTATMPEIQSIDTADFSYTLRPTEERDLPAINDFRNANSRREPGMDGETETSSLSGLQDWWRSPQRLHESWLLAHLINPDDSEGLIIGEVSCQVEEQLKDGIRNAWGELYINPDYRNRGAGSYLYNTMLTEATTRNADVLHTFANTTHKLMQQFIERRGFEFDRYFWQMRLDAGVAVPSVELPAGYTVRTYVPGQDLETFRTVRNETFADHFGSTPRTSEEMQHVVDLSWFQPEGLFFTYAPDGELAGYCWAAINTEEWERRGAKIGWIEHLGVMPTHRRAGLGRAMLLTGVHYLRQTCDIVELGVEGKNAKALPLYEGVGFHQHNGWFNLKKELRTSHDRNNDSTDRA